MVAWQYLLSYHCTAHITAGLLNSPVAPRPPPPPRLIKAGFVSKAYEARLAKVTAWSELIGYSANVALNAMRIRALQQREQQLMEELRRKQQVGRRGEGEMELQLACLGWLCRTGCEFDMNSETFVLAAVRGCMPSGRALVASMQSTWTVVPTWCWAAVDHAGRLAQLWAPAEVFCTQML